MIFLHVCIHSFVFFLLQLTEVDLGIWETVDLYLHTACVPNYISDCDMRHYLRNSTKTKEQFSKRQR